MVATLTLGLNEAGVELEIPAAAPGSGQGRAATIDWYRSQQDWVRRVKSGEYRNFYEMNYANRGGR